MKKLLIGCFLVSGFAVASSNVEETRLCDPENYVYVPITTSCGKSAVASGCTTEDIVADTISWDQFLCEPEPLP